VTGAGSKKSPVEKLSLAAEVFVVHDHFDAAAAVPWAAGMMVNRHVWSGRRIRRFSPVGRNSPGEDRTPTGAFVSLAARARGSDRLGGELQRMGPDDTRTAHQREWDYLKGHVEKACALFRAERTRRLSGYAMWSPSTELTGSELTEWEKFVALTEYAAHWKMRQKEVYPSFHPVDVLYNSSYCSGTANVLCALALVAGFKIRGIHISSHSMMEVRVGKKWVWADNNATLHGARAGAHGYAEVTAEPGLTPYLGSGARYLSMFTSRYRSPWHYSGAMYWHFCDGECEGRGERDDVRDGYGLTVPYDPSTAAALYPELRVHCFHVPKGSRPYVCLTEKGAFVQAAVRLDRRRAFRKRFFVSACPDNPIREGAVKFRMTAKPSPGAFRCALDGVPLTQSRAGSRYGRPTLEYAIPRSLLTPGVHELVLSAVRRSPAACLFYPDIVEPYSNPVSGPALNVPDSAFSVEPVVREKALLALVGGRERM